MGKSKEIMQSNEITRGVYKLTLYQKRFLMLAIANVNKSGLSKIELKEFSSIYGLSIKDAKKVLKKERLKILSSSIAFDFVNGQWDAVNWLQSIKFDGEGVYTVLFTDEVKERITNLKKNFTKVDLLNAAKLKSIFAMRIYEIASQYKNDKKDINQFYLTVKDIKEQFMLPQSYLDNATLLQSKIVKPACDEIVEKTGVFITYKPVKKSRSVDHFVFQFYDKSFAVETN